MKKLILVADDFGLTQGVNDGIIDAYENGILTEMSIMMDSPGTLNAIAKAKSDSIRNIGLHITLNDIVGTGIYMRTNDYIQLLETADAKTLSSRVNDEIKKFEDALGMTPTHINGHHNCHLHPKVIETVAEYSVRNSIYVRKKRDFTDGHDAGLNMNEFLAYSGVKVTDYIFEHIKGSYQESFDGFIKDLENLKEESVTELFFHPGFVDDELRSYSSLLEGRERDVKLLKDVEFKSKLVGMVFELGGFR